MAWSNQQTTCKHKNQFWVGKSFFSVPEELRASILHGLRLKYIKRCKTSSQSTKHYMNITIIIQRTHVKRVRKVIRTYIFPVELDNLLMRTKGAICLRALKSLTTKRQFSDGHNLMVHTTRGLQTMAQQHSKDHSKQLHLERNGTLGESTQPLTHFCLPLSQTKTSLTPKGKVLLQINVSKTRIFLKTNKKQL